MPVIGVKSVPGCLVTIAPSLRGEPVAFWPLPSPHLEAVTPPVLAVPPPEVVPPQAAAMTEKEIATANAAGARNLPWPTLVLNILSPPNRREALWPGTPARRAWPIPVAEARLAFHIAEHPRREVRSAVRGCSLI